MLKKIKRTNLLGLAVIVVLFIGIFVRSLTSEQNTEARIPEEENTLVIVTPCSADLYESIMFEFQQKYHCQLKIMEKTEEEIYGELRANGGKLEGDVIFAISDNLTQKSRQSFALYKPLMQTEMILAYNLNVLEPKEIPQGIADLADVRWKSTIGCVYENADFKYETVREYALANGMTEEQWRQYQNNIAMYADSEDDVASGIIDGKYLIGIVSKEKALLMTKEESNIKYCKLGKEECPVKFNVCIPRECKQQMLAAQFLEFCGNQNLEQYLSEYLYFEKVTM